MPDAVSYLQTELDKIVAARGIPAIAAVLVRDGGTRQVSAARGLRKKGTTINVLDSDRFCFGSISKPITGYLITLLVQQKQLTWTTRIRDVFPELADARCRSRYGARADYLDATVEQLMSHSSRLPYVPLGGYEQLVGSAKFRDDRSAEHNSEGSLLHRRYLYVVSAMADPPAALGTYSGGSIVCAAMAERRLNATYESLMKRFVFDPLGMSRSAFGRTCSTPASSPDPDGVCGHGIDATGAMTVEPTTNSPQRDFYGHAPAGSYIGTAADMGRFIAANIVTPGVPKPVVTDPELQDAQALAPLSPTVARAGWLTNPAPSVPPPPGYDAQVFHDGNDGNFYSSLRIHTAGAFGLAAVVNASTTASGVTNAGADAVQAAMGVMEDMHARWAILGF